MKEVADFKNALYERIKPLRPHDYEVVFNREWNTLMVRVGVMIHGSEWFYQFPEYLKKAAFPNSLGISDLTVENAEKLSRRIHEQCYIIRSEEG